MDTTPRKRGGPQPGSGRPKKEPGQKMVKVNITMTQEDYEATRGNRSEMIREALELYRKYKIPFYKHTLTKTTLVQVKTGNNWGDKLVLEVKGYED